MFSSHPDHGGKVCIMIFFCCCSKSLCCTDSVSLLLFHGNAHVSMHVEFSFCARGGTAEGGEVYDGF